MVTAKLRFDWQAGDSREDVRPDHYRQRKSCKEAQGGGRSVSAAGRRGGGSRGVRPLESFR